MTAAAGRLALAALCLFAAPVLAAPPAAAHTELIGSRPAAGALVASRTSEVVLSFTGPVRPELSTIVLSGPGNSRLGPGTPSVRGLDVVQTIDRPLPAGAWTLAYRVVAADGHPITGTVAFTVSAGPSTADSPGSTTASPELPDAAAPPSGAAAVPSPVAAQQGAGTSPRGGDEASYGGPLAASAAVLVLGAGAVLALRRRGSPRA